jgi:tetratricopeptide (TPR) repeat protein
MLYLIEAARDDTVALKRLGNALLSLQTQQYEAARDSLKQLLATRAAPHAYYYLARVYEKQDDIPLAIGSLQELSSKFPDHTIHSADLFTAELYRQSDNINKAREILEQLVVNAPNSIYAVQAREMLTQLSP